MIKPAYDPLWNINDVTDDVINGSSSKIDYVENDVRTSDFQTQIIFSMVSSLCQKWKLLIYSEESRGATYLLLTFFEELMFRPILLILRMRD